MIRARKEKPLSTHEELWDAYTRQVLEWRLGDAPVFTALRENFETANRMARRILRLRRFSGRDRCLLMGSGHGLLTELMAQNLPRDAGPLVLECDPGAARAALLRLPPSARLLADASPWALLLLTRAAGLEPDDCTLVWTLPAKTQPGGQALETWRKLFTGARAETLPLSGVPAPRMSVGCIMHPNEPGLEEFFAHIPPWAHEVCVVWDGAPPEQPLPCPAVVKSIVRPLDGNFAAQRNAMLDLCEGEWCLCLDADERLEAAVWEALPRLMAHADTDGVLFPRLTFEGDARRARIGYGLWPDVQLRLFPLRSDRERPRFTGAVHERVRGLGERLILAPGMPLLHFSHVTKDRDALARRLAVFDAAGKGEIAHTLSKSYPTLDVSLLRETERMFGHTRVLRPPRLSDAAQEAPLPLLPRSCTLI